MSATRYSVYLIYRIAVTKVLRVTVTNAGENEVTQIIHSVVAEHRGADEFHTVLALHDWVIDNCEYDHSHVYYSADSLFLNKTGVCNSYTRALALLLREAGITCRRVSGYAYGDPGAGHAWLAAQIDGEWYLFDPTWDDQSGEFYWHAYFAVNADLMEMQHTPQHYSGGIF